jgi:oligopeptide transport system substrate-binding protein
MGVIPDSAKRWEVLDDGKRYVFHLRDDLYWTDGVQITAKDYEFSWKWLLDPEQDLPAAVVLEDIKNAKAYSQGKVTEDCVGIKVTDDFVLEIELERPISYFPHLLTNIVTFPIPRHQFEKHGSAWSNPEHIVTNGPFKLVNWKPREGIILERNLLYPGQFRGNVDRVEITFLANCEDDIIEMYEQDQIDFVRKAFIKQADWERLRRNYASDYISYPQIGFGLIGFDCSCPPFDDVRVRRALTMATDRDQIVNIDLGGYDLPATGGFIPPGMPGHCPNIGLPYDPQESRRLLTESGYTEGRNFPEMECVSLYVPQYFDLSSGILQHYLNTLGLSIKRRLVGVRWFAENPLPSLWAVGEVLSILDPIHFLRSYAGGGHPGWKNNEFDKLISQALETTDPKERIKIAQKADEIIVEEAPILPFLYMRTHMMVKPWMRGVPMLPTRRWVLKDIILEPH